MRQLFVKELFSYFKNKFFYALMFIYTAVSLVSCFYMGKFFEIATNNLSALFYFQPNILSFFIPVFAVKLWSEERKSNTIELLMSQSMSFVDVVFAKFLACFCFGAVLLLMTLPFFVWSVFYINLDYLSVFSSYLACLLSIMAMSAISCMVACFFVGPAYSYICSLFITWLVFWAGFSNNFLEILYGQVGLDNLLYFIVIAAFCLCINIYYIKTKFVKDKKLVYFILVQIASAVLVILLAKILFAPFKFDVSYSQNFTLSKEAKEILTNKDSVVEIDLYYSDFRGIDDDRAQYIKNVARFLRQIPNASFNAIKIMPFSDEEIMANGLEFEMIENEKYNLYAGIVLKANNKVVVIKSLIPENLSYLESDVVRAIFALYNNDRKTLGVISGDNSVLRKNFGIIRGKDWPFVDELKKNYDVFDISENIIQIPAEIDVLLVVNKPKSVLLKYVIDQYLMRGGRVLIVENNIDFEYDNLNFEKEGHKRFDGEFRSAFSENIFKKAEYASQMLPHFLLSVNNPKLVLFEENLIGDDVAYNKKEIELLLKELDYLTDNAEMQTLKQKRTLVKDFSIKEKIEEDYSAKYLPEVEATNVDIDNIKDEILALLYIEPKGVVEFEKIEQLENEITKKQEYSKKIAYVLEEETKAKINKYILLNIFVFPSLLLLLMFLSFGMFRRRYVKI